MPGASDHRSSRSRLPDPRPQATPDQVLGRDKARHPRFLPGRLESGLRRPDDALQRGPFGVSETRGHAARHLGRNIASSSSNPAASRRASPGHLFCRPFRPAAYLRNRLMPAGAITSPRCRRQPGAPWQLASVANAADQRQATLSRGAMRPIGNRARPAANLPVPGWRRVREGGEGAHRTCRERPGVPGREARTRTGELTELEFRGREIVAHEACPRPLRMTELEFLPREIVAREACARPRRMTELEFTPREIVAPEISASREELIASTAMLIDRRT